MGKAIQAWIGLAFLAAASGAQAFTLEFPGPATPTAAPDTTRASFAMPTGRWTKDGLPSKIIDGTIERAAWQIDTPGLSSLDLIQPLRAQLLAAGFTPVFECETQGCGGFDFRFAIDVLPEPDMHVDLGDFRYLSVEREVEAGPEAIGLLVSRSASKGFVQITRAIEDAGPPLFAATNIVTQQDTPLLPATDSDLAQLFDTGTAVLEGLDFGTGAADLSEGPYAALATLADWLLANPDRRVALVGHTDASGRLEGNIVISKRRAASVRTRLIEVYGIPPAQIEAQGVGYLAPIASNLTEEGRQKNRRVEAILTAAE
ncbi:OmpA family protein [Pseudorhodobacter turbinis]|uniref:OmpA family protein n=1 Tax=Pseudorhodobacter turbinis TaxID=2500533 RepID=A0A4P8EHZ1_9RHOB|nr:OmpA family protein [Pseudorhodobacter turbinis]QCO56215.1 OmpA family protein [Pseudorhodobacter turbinis]